MMPTMKFIKFAPKSKPLSPLGAVPPAISSTRSIVLMLMAKFISFTGPAAFMAAMALTLTFSACTKDKHKGSPSDSSQQDPPHQTHQKFKDNSKNNQPTDSQDPLKEAKNSSSLHVKRSETFFSNLSAEPENLHPIRSTDYYSRVIQDYILESLLQRNKDTYEWDPLLAKSWKIHPSGKTFTFELHDNLKWSDGKDLTAQDIKFSFEAYKNPKYGGISSIPYFEKLESVQILSEKTVQFKVKDPYFGNFQTIATMNIIPEHIYKDPEAKLSKTMVGSGPYMMDKYIKGKMLVLKKNTLWAGQSHPANMEKWNFPWIAFRFVQTDADVLLRMEKEHLDYAALSAESFVKKTNTPPWGTKIKKIEYQNKQPSGYGFIGFNFKKPLFKDIKVRKALVHLFHGELMNKKFYYNQRELARGPWYFWSDYADETVKAMKFNPKKAIEILKSAGWDDRDQNGVLEKTIQGKQKELSFTILFSNSESEKLLTLFQEDAKQAGVQIHLKVLDWASFLRLIEDKKFDAAMLGWSGGSIDIDPKQIWHTESARNKGSNFINYSNPQVDALIDKGRTQLNRKKRIKTFKKIYRLIAEDVPYIFMFNSRKRFYGIHSRVESPANAFNYDSSQPYWKLKATSQ